MKNNQYKITWDLSPLFESDNDVKIQVTRKDVEAKAKNFIKKWKSNSAYLKKPVILKGALDEYESFERSFSVFGSESYYFSLRESLDQISPDLKGKNQKIHELSTKLWNELQFFTHSISKIPAEDQKIFLKSEVLEKYKHFLEKLFAESKYLLSDKEERIMNLKSGPSHSNWVRMTSTFLSKETINKKTLPELLGLLNDQNKKKRDQAAKAFNQILEKYVDVAENEINSVLENKKINDELRGFDRPDKARHIVDDIDTPIVDILSETVYENFDIPQRFYKLKASLLGQKKLAYHERNVPIGKLSKKISYDEAVDLVFKVFTNLDQEFAAIFMNFVQNGQIDVYPKKGKRDGAFCAHGLPVSPTYILLNYNNQLNDVLTLAHESGHGINNELIRKKQNSLNFGTPTSTAEVASTFTEDFVLSEILRNADDELRLSVQMMKLNDDISTIFRQIAAYRFEQQLHKDFREKGYLAKEEIGKIFSKHMSSYMGEYVEQSKGSENWWVYWNHIRYFFYNYSYASGLLTSKALQSKVKQDSEFILQVKKFLSTGLSKSPQDIFLELGVDISKKEFWQEGILEIRNLLKETEILANKLNKVKS